MARTKSTESQTNSLSPYPPCCSFPLRTPPLLSVSPYHRRAAKTGWPHSRRTGLRSPKGGTRLATGAQVGTSICRSSGLRVPSAGHSAETRWLKLHEAVKTVQANQDPIDVLLVGECI